MRFNAQTGQIEWLLAPNLRFADALADKGYLHSYEELPSGHNWATWEQGLEPGLKYLFGMPDYYFTTILATPVNHIVAMMRDSINSTERNGFVAYAGGDSLLRSISWQRVDQQRFVILSP